MSQFRSLCFEALEARRLLSRTHVVPHARPAMMASPLVLDGTLTVENKATTTTMNLDGSTTTSVPVAGQLGTLGEVHGVWTESVDTYGDPTGPDTLQLHDAKGTFLVAFNEQNAGREHRLAGGAVDYAVAQRVYDGTGAYARASESGSIELTTNSARTVVQSMTLNTQTK